MQYEVNQTIADVFHAFSEASTFFISATKIYQKHMQLKASKLAESAGANANTMGRVEDAKHELLGT